MGRIFERVVSKGPKVRAIKLTLCIRNLLAKIKEIIAILPSESSRRLRREKLKLDDSGNAIFFKST